MDCWSSVGRLLYEPAWFRPFSEAEEVAGTGSDEILPLAPSVSTTSSCRTTEELLLRSFMESSTIASLSDCD